MSHNRRVQITADALVVLRSNQNLTRELGFVDPHASLFLTEEGSRLANTIIEHIEPLYIPYNLARYRFFMDKLSQTNFSQIVFLGVGYDTRSLWQPELQRKGLQIYEVDFSEKLQHKKEQLDLVGVTIPSHVHHVAADLADVHLLQKLKKAGFSTIQKTLVVSEGVKFFLSSDVAERILNPEFWEFALHSSLLFDFWTHLRVNELNQIFQAKFGRTLFSTFLAAQTSLDVCCYLQKLGYKNVNITALDDIVSQLYKTDHSTPLSSGWLVAEASL